MPSISARMASRSDARSSAAAQMAAVSKKATLMRVMVSPPEKLFGREWRRWGWRAPRGGPDASTPRGGGCQQQRSDAECQRIAPRNAVDQGESLSVFG